MKNNWYKYFNYGTIILALIAAVLLFLEKLPLDWYIPVLIFMVIVFILRIIVRFYLVKVSKIKN